MNKDKLQIGDLVVDRHETYRDLGVGLVVRQLYRNWGICGVYWFKYGKILDCSERHLTKLSSTQDKTK